MTWASIKEQEYVVDQQRDPYADFRAPATAEADAFIQELKAASSPFEGFVYAYQLDQLNNGIYANWDQTPYPQVLRQMQQTEDELFATRFPEEAAKIEAIFGTPDERWQQAERLRRDLLEVLRQGDVDPRYILTVSAKSNAKIFAKAKEYGIPYTQIFDTVRARIVTGDHTGTNEEEKQLGQAEAIERAIRQSGKFPLMSPPVVFSRKNSLVNASTLSPVHDPYRRTLRGGSRSGFPRVRMNVYTDGILGEVQIITSRTFRDLNERNRLSHRR